MNKLCDLHTHSTASDGSFTPEELVNAAIDLNLSAIALTDHNAIDGLPAFLAAASNKSIEAIAGAEFSVDYSGTELHMLGLFIEPVYFSQTTDFMKETINRKEESNIKLIESLRKIGYSLDYDDIKRNHATGKVNRSVIGDALVEAGFIESKTLAFQTLPLAKAHGLVGMECYHSDHDAKQINLALKFTQSFDILPSGGSDFHGVRKPGIYLGKGRNNIEVPYQWALNLKEARQTRFFLRSTILFKHNLIHDTL